MSYHLIERSYCNYPRSHVRTHLVSCLSYLGLTFLAHLNMHIAMATSQQQAMLSSTLMSSLLPSMMKRWMTKTFLSLMILNYIPNSCTDLINMESFIFGL
jgi:hypothetical protein